MDPECNPTLKKIQSYGEGLKMFPNLCKILWLQKLALD